MQECSVDVPTGTEMHDSTVCLVVVLSNDLGLSIAKASFLRKCENYTYLWILGKYLFIIVRVYAALNKLVTVDYIQITKTSLALGIYPYL